jgi:hypothetical protein
VYTEEVTASLLSVQNIVNITILFSKLSGLFFSGIVGTKQPKNQKVQGELKAVRLALDLLSGCFSPGAK